MTDKKNVPPAPFDPVGGVADAEAGIAQAVDAAPEALRVAIEAAFEKTAKAYSYFTSDHIWYTFEADNPGVTVPNKRVIGDVLRHAHKVRSLIDVGYMKSQRRDRQSGIVTIYWSELAPASSPVAAGVVVTVLMEVLAERARQDKLWGGPDHDDGHPFGDWLDFIQLQLSGLFGGDGSARGRLIKIAALAIAAVESMDRQVKKKAAA